MDAVSIAPFPDTLPIAKPLSIIHIVSLVIGAFFFYPFFLTQKNPILLWCAVGCHGICFVTSLFIETDIQWISALVCGLIAFQLRSIQLQKHLPDWIESSLSGLIVAMSVLYLGMASQDLTESCHGDSLECRMPLFMGTGFVMYGTLVLLNLVSILKLPRLSTPEYYEALVLSFWGLVCLMMSGTSILGSEWKALNVGLLWFTGGLFSISLTVQSWIPTIRERNIVNSLVICLTGRAIVVGITDGDDYAAAIHTLLGHLLIIGSLARVLQIAFRKSALENYGLFQTEQEENKSSTCKHTTLFASITMLSGLLVSIAGITVGVLFMGASQEWLAYMRYYIQDPSLYLNCAVAVAFLWSAYLFVLCTVYKKHSHRADLGCEYHELESAIESVAEHWEVAEPTEPIMISPTEPTSMRPSEYRAKRRSLLVATNTLRQQRSRSSSGVGGVLPDEINSKRSSGGSTGYFSESPISSPENIPFASVSSTYPHSSHHPRRNSAGPLDYLALESVHKTESGRRKERLIGSYFVPSS